MYTELKAKSSMEALQALQVGSARVARREAGERRELLVPAEELVPGLSKGLERALKGDLRGF